MIAWHIWVSRGQFKGNNWRNWEKPCMGCRAGYSSAKSACSHPHSCILVCANGRTTLMSTAGLSLLSTYQLPRNPVGVLKYCPWLSSTYSQAMLQHQQQCANCTICCIRHVVETEVVEASTTSLEDKDRLDTCSATVFEHCWLKRQTQAWLCFLSQQCSTTVTEHVTQTPDSCRWPEWTIQLMGQLYIRHQHSHINTVPVVAAAVAVRGADYRAVLHRATASLAMSHCSSCLRELLRKT